MAKIALMIAGMPDGSAIDVDGMYIAAFDFEHDNGLGAGCFTEKIERALQFDDFESALEFYHRQPKCKPFREDGKPNRPITATNIAMVPVPEDKEQKP